ncbi:MAG: phenylalanine--tRNA ligase subunit alpha [Candidatus Komeilibacteria bacterium]|nr:phenylalanine--tRNA ligase subunit alpha [Candidatus Komeilibacteria bacterium]
MENQLKKLLQQAVAEIKQSRVARELEAVEKKYLGRNGELTKLLKGLKDLSEEAKPVVGQLANEVKEEVARAVEEVKANFQPVEQLGFFDPTQPGIKPSVGHLHPNTIIQYQLEDLFQQFGFMVLDGPQLESDYYNFSALNIPDSHPARETQDTFWLKNGFLLRTQTSNTQVRALEKYGAPLRIIVPGRVFRAESTDVSHDHTFYQLEGLMVDKDISIGHLVGTMKALLSAIFKKEVKIRLRPGFFPFVEPGFELDINCLICNGDGCSVCKQSGWVELMPCGMVHPRVLEAGGVDPNEYSGFAFGLGLTRLVMMKYLIDDIRLLQSGDLRFLQQF